MTPELDWASSCTVEIECDPGSTSSSQGVTISCTSTSGNCSTQGDCVYCDGVQQSCCSEVVSCLDQCHFDYLVCFSDCNSIMTPCTQACQDEKATCENSCY